MLTAAVLGYLDALGRDDVTRAADVRTQVAFVRSIVDEIDRYRGSDAFLNELDQQLDEEMDRLARMISRSGEHSIRSAGGQTRGHEENEACKSGSR